MGHRCEACGRTFQPCKTVPSQKYCSRRECQRERHRLWQRRKLKEDGEYRANQAAAQRSWREKHPDYWQQYRASHQEYVERNRSQQQERNLRRRLDQAGEAIAKMDALTSPKPLISGRYRLTPLFCNDELIAKMDALTVRIEVISNG